MIAVLPVIGRKHHVLFVTRKNRFDAFHTAFERFFRIAFDLLPPFGDDVQRETEYRNGHADADDGNTRIFENIAEKFKCEFYDLIERVNDKRIEEMSHTGKYSARENIFQ